MRLAKVAETAQGLFPKYKITHTPEAWWKQLGVVRYFFASEFQRAYIANEFKVSSAECRRTQTRRPGGYTAVPQYRTTDSSERALSRLTLSFATGERCGWHREQADTSNGGLEGSKRVSCLINTRVRSLEAKGFERQSARF